MMWFSHQQDLCGHINIKTNIEYNHFGNEGGKWCVSGGHKRDHSSFSVVRNQ